MFCLVCNGDPLKIDRGETDVSGIVTGDTDDAEEMDVVELGPGEIESVETDSAEVDPVDIVDVTELDSIEVELSEGVSIVSDQTSLDALGNVTLFRFEFCLVVFLGVGTAHSGSGDVDGDGSFGSKVTHPFHPDLGNRRLGVSLAAWLGLPIWDVCFPIFIEWT